MFTFVASGWSMPLPDSSLTLTLKAANKKKLQQTTLYFLLLLSFKANKAWCFIWILCLAEDSHEISSFIFSLKKKGKKYSWMSSAGVMIGALRVNRSSYSTPYPPKQAGAKVLIPRILAFTKIKGLDLRVLSIFIFLFKLF